MRILVTGGLGFIGHNVVSQLEELKHEVTIVDNFTDYGIIPSEELNALMLERQKEIYSVNYVYDIAEPALEAAFMANRPEIVIHLASFPRQKVVNSNPVLAADTMMKGLLNVCELSCEYKVKKFVYISSSMVYGNYIEGTDEYSFCKPQGQYAIMKLAGEHLVRDYGHKGCFDYTILRPSAVYGPRDVEDRVISKFFMAAMRDEDLVVKGKDEKLDFTYVTDTASGIVQAALSDNTVYRTYNITRGKAFTLLEAAELVTKIVGKGHIKITYRDEDYPSRGALNINAAKRDFNFDPKIDLEEGLNRYYEYLQNSPLWSQKTV
jgi:nucleoside-diphosphate-sugar epimerase